MKYLMVTAFVLISSMPLLAQHAGHDHHHNTVYSGQERRDIKSLSAEDIAELRSGGGWGLAKPAELNGVPGPAHLLELKGEIPLTPNQITAIEAIFEYMRTNAIREGERYIERELALELAFREQTLTDDDLRRMLAEIEESRSQLRYIHLSAHLATLPLLNDGQIERYNTLRGYTTDPCSNVPEGHDPAMWRRHNDCE